MVGSIDPRCETVRGTHWPEDRSCGCLELASRKPSWPAVQSDRTNRPDIWMQAIRSDLKNLLCHGGRPHMGPGLRRDDVLLLLLCRYSSPICVRSWNQCCACTNFFTFGDSACGLVSCTTHTSTASSTISECACAISSSCLALSKVSLASLISASTFGFM